MRFHGQNEDETEDEFFGEDADEGMEEMFYEDNSQIKMAELDLVAANLSRRILVGAVKMLETSIWWKFLSHKTRLRMIRESYQTFNELIEE